MVTRSLICGTLILDSNLAIARGLEMVIALGRGRVMQAIDKN